MAQNIYGTDRNQIAWQYESGTYATVSGGFQWPGYAQSLEFDDDQGLKKRPQRFVGQGDRNVGVFIDKASEYGFTLSTIPQDWKMMLFTLGVNADAGSPSPFTHTITEVNSENVDKCTGEVMPSFALENAKRTLIDGSGVNWIRTIKGCVIDTLTFATSEGEPVTLEIAGRGKTMTYASGIAGSGAGGTVTEATTVPFQWEHTTVAIPSGTATALDTLKEVSITVSNNLAPTNFIDGTINANMPVPQGRDYEVALTINADPATMKAYYDQYLIGGSTFNMQVVSAITAGSNDIIWTFSGCEMMECTSPTEAEGVTEISMTIKPEKSAILVNDAIEYYNIGSYA